jgi:hypothetical protein
MNNRLSGVVTETSVRRKDGYLNDIIFMVELKANILKIY